MSKRQKVGCAPDNGFGVLGDFLKKARKNPIWIERLKIMLKGRNPFEQVREVATKVKNWLQSIVDSERQCHKAFFDKTFGLAEFTTTLKRYGTEKIEAWKKLDLEPHFLPAISLSQDSNLLGWKIKPEEWFYKQLIQGKIFQMNRGELQKLTTVNLGGITVLVDTRLKPKYGDEYKDDWFSSIIEQLRKDGKIEDFNPRSSRFNVSAEETDLIRIEAAKILSLKPEQLRLEREIEANVIPQLYPYMPRVNDGRTDTWEWREEFFEGRGSRLRGGCSDIGGLADVRYFSVGSRWGYRAFRFLAVL